MKFLEENPQITLIFDYTYEGEEFSVIISGSNVKADPEISWYGPLCLYGLFGGYNIGEGIKTSGTYTVQSKDTLSDIAAKLNTSVKTLVELNGIKDPDHIFAGQVLKY